MLPERRRFAGAALAYGFFVVYGSLIPFAWRSRPLSQAWDIFLHTPYLALGIGSRADWVANILLYVVLAYFATGAVWASRLGRELRVVLLGLVFSACLGLAVGIEFLQQFFPPRTVSLNDLLAEAIGTGLGALCWFVSGKRIAVMWERFLAGGANSLRALLALYAVVYFGLSFFPYDFLVSPGELAAKLAKPDSLSLGPGLTCGTTFTCGVKMLAEVVLAMPFGVLLTLTAAASRKPDARPFRPVGGFAAGAAIGLVVEGVQILLASGTTQAISVFTRALGTAWGVALARSHPSQWGHYSPTLVRRGVLILLPAYLALALALNDVLPLHLQPAWAAGEKLAELRFMPFYYHYYTSETAAVRSLLFVAGTYAPIGFAAALAWPGQHRRAAWLGALVAAGLCSGIEVLKLFSVGKHPDPTNLLIAATSAWLMHWLVQRLLSQWRRLRETASPPQPAARAPGRSLKPLLMGGALPALTLLLVVVATVPSTPPPASP